MTQLTDIIIALIAVQHVGFLILEMFFWTKPLGLKIFRLERATADASAVLAKNQGLYNGFLAAGLVWSLLASDPGQAFMLKIFFLSCILAAGVFGGATASWGILWIQGIPAAIALIILYATLHGQ